MWLWSTALNNNKNNNLRMRNTRLVDYELSRHIKKGTYVISTSYSFREEAQS